ncbi:hypothetical protein ACTL6U_16320 [Rhodovibrionaceae bacterium A322]
MDSLLLTIQEEPASLLLAVMLVAGVYLYFRTKKNNEIVSLEGESRRHLTERLNLELTQDGYDPASPEGKELFKERWKEETEDPG